MTPLKYITEAKICTTAELLAFKREYPKDFTELLEMARVEMRHNNVPIEEAPQK